MDSKTSMWTPLMIACSQRNFTITEYILNHGANPEYKYGFDSAIKYAISSNSIECVKLLLETNKVDVNDTVVDNGLSLLSYACKLSYESIVEYHLSKGASVNSMTCYKDTYQINANDYLSKDSFITPLHFAYYNGSFNIIQTLVKYNADIHSLTFNEYLSYHYPCMSNNPDLIKILEYFLKNNESLIERTIDNKTILSRFNKLLCVMSINNYSESNSFVYLSNFHKIQNHSRFITAFSFLFENEQNVYICVVSSVHTERFDTFIFYFFELRKNC